MSCLIRKFKPSVCSTNSDIMKLFLIALVLQMISVALVMEVPVADDDEEGDVPPPEQHTLRFAKAST